MGALVVNVLFSSWIWKESERTSERKEGNTKKIWRLSVYCIVLIVSDSSSYYGNGGGETLSSNSSVSTRRHSNNKTSSARHLPDRDSQLSLLYWRKFLTGNLRLQNPDLFTQVPVPKPILHFYSQQGSKNVACVKKMVFAREYSKSTVELKKKTNRKGKRQDPQHYLDDAMASTNL